MNKDLNEVLNYMKQYIENIYEHDSEPMLNWKDLKLVLDEIERLKNIIKEVRDILEPLIALEGTMTAKGMSKLLEILDKGE